jgi:hypothetical protein
MGRLNNRQRLEQDPAMKHSPGLSPYQVPLAARLGGP